MIKNSLLVILLLTIAFSLYNSSFVSITIYDLPGKFIRLLANEIKDEGEYNFSYPTFDLSNGLFLITIEMDNKVVTKPLLIKK